MKTEELQMFEYLIEIEPRLYDRFLTVERNVKAASNSFYDAYLDLQEQFIKTVAVSCGFDIKARETCGELLRRTDVQNYFKEILHIDDFTYNKMQDYTLKVNAHKHKGEKNIQIDTIVSYMRIFYNATKAFAVYKNINVPDFDADCFINIFGYFEKENTSLKTEMQKLKEELLSSVESGKLKESDIENYQNLLSQAEIDKLSLYNASISTLTDDEKINIRNILELSSIYFPINGNTTTDLNEKISSGTFSYEESTSNSPNNLSGTLIVFTKTNVVNQLA